MFFLHILILYHLLEEVIFTLYYLYTTTNKLASELDTTHELIAIAEKRLNSVDTYFNFDNKWLRTFVETGALNEMTPELIRQLIDRIDVYSDQRVQITFSYNNWMEPLLDCFNELQAIEAEENNA